MRCPLPIDWLDYLEGERSPERTQHLLECRSCELLVRRLEGDLPTRGQLRIASPPDPESWPRWPEVRSEPVAIGDIRWSGGPAVEQCASLGRIVLLATSHPRQEGGRAWIEVAPLSNDIELATSLDLVLRREDTDLRVPWRVLLRHQTIVAQDELGPRVGKLTAAGLTVFEAVHKGHAPEDRFGSAIEGPDDPRPLIPEEMAQILFLLGSTYAKALEHEPRGQGQARMLVVAMQRVADLPGAREGLRLAADTAVPEEGRLWAVEIPHRGRMQGRVEHQYDADELLFVIEGVEQGPLGLGSEVQITVLCSRTSTSASRAPIQVSSRPFAPSVGEHVLLARGEYVFPKEIESLEVRLHDEG